MAPYMKTLAANLVCALTALVMLSPSVRAQNSNARRPRRVTPQTQPAQAQPAPSQQSQTTTNTAPPPSIVIRTQIVVRLVQPPPDPEKVKAAKEETLRKTVEFQKKRAEEGSESAQYELGMRYLKGEGVEKDEATGRKWLEQSAKNGFSPAATKLEDLDKPTSVKAEKTDPKLIEPKTAVTTSAAGAR